MTEITILEGWASKLRWLFDIWELLQVVGLSSDSSAPVYTDTIRQKWDRVQVKKWWQEVRWRYWKDMQGVKWQPQGIGGLTRWVSNASQQEGPHFTLLFAFCIVHCPNVCIMCLRPLYSLAKEHLFIFSHHKHELQPILSEKHRHFFKSILQL